MFATAEDSNYTLLTGATGLVGSMLMRDLLRKRKRVAVVVRPKRGQLAEERVESLLQYWESHFGERLARPVCLAGDVNDASLGLDHDAQQWLVRHCDRVLHNAAVVEFTATSDRSEPWQTNVDGTHRILELCRDLGLREFHYVSTAYVCGRRQGVIFESELEMGQCFRNDYEHSKYLAEKLVRAADFIAPATIYRPVAIGGDSRTGFTNTYHGVSAYLRVLHKLMAKTRPGRDGRRHAPLRIAMDGNECRNIVPVDWVSEAICRLLDNPGARGRTFHLAPRIPLKSCDFFDAAYRFFNAYGYEFCGRGRELAGETTLLEKAYLRHVAPYEDYELTDPRFDTANLDHFGGDLPSGRIDETVLQCYLRFGAEDRWGKRPLQKATEPVWSEDLLRQTLAASRDWPSPVRSACLLGLDVIGAGGGQWQLTLDASKPPTINPGLPRKTQPVVRLSVDRLARLLGASATHQARASDSDSRVPSRQQVRRSRRLLRSLATRLDRSSTVARQSRAA